MEASDIYQHMTKDLQEYHYEQELFISAEQPGRVVFSSK